MRHSITAAQIMTVDLVTLPRSMTVAEAAELLVRSRVSSAPVVDVDFTRDLLVGFVSEKDLMQCYASGRVHADPGIRVDALMRPHPVCVKPEADLFTLAAIFMQHGYRHVPVTVGQVLQGMVSRRDVLAALVDDYRQWRCLDPDTRQAPDLSGVFTSRFLIG